MTTQEQPRSLAGIIRAAIDAGFESQTDAGKAWGFKQQTLNGWLRGLPPGKAMRPQLAKVLGMSEDELDAVIRADKFARRAGR